MNEEIAKQIIVFVFKRNGKNEISESDFFLTISIKLQWCPPHTAKHFVERIIQEGLLIKKNELLSAGFPTDLISIQTGFKPSHEFFKEFEPKQSSLDVASDTDLFSKIASDGKLSIEQLRTAVEIISDEKVITRDIALLLFAKKQNINFMSYIIEVENAMFSEDI